MGVKDLRSRFDRHTIQDPVAPPTQISEDTLAPASPLSGQTVAGPDIPPTGPIPSQGAYFSDKMTSDSPFDTVRGLKMDQMVQMLDDTVKSDNHGYPRGPGTMTYGPSPGGTEQSPFQDMNGNEFGEDFVNPLTGNYIGRYSNPDTGATF